MKNASEVLIVYSFNKSLGCLFAYLPYLPLYSYLLHFHNSVTRRLVVDQVRTRKIHRSYEHECSQTSDSIQNSNESTLQHAQLRQLQMDASHLTSPAHANCIDFYPHMMWASQFRLLRETGTSQMEDYYRIGNSRGIHYKIPFFSRSLPGTSGENILREIEERRKKIVFKNSNITTTTMRMADVIESLF